MISVSLETLWSGEISLQFPMNSVPLFDWEQGFISRGKVKFFLKQALSSLNDLENSYVFQGPGCSITQAVKKDFFLHHIQKISFKVFFDFYHYQVLNIKTKKGQFCFSKKMQGDFFNVYFKKKQIALVLKNINSVFPIKKNHIVQLRDAWNISDYENDYYNQLLFLEDIQNYIYDFHLISFLKKNFIINSFLYLSLYSKNKKENLYKLEKVYRKQIHIVLSHENELGLTKELKFYNVFKEQFIQILETDAQKALAGRMELSEKQFPYLGFIWQKTTDVFSNGYLQNTSSKHFLYRLNKIERNLFFLKLEQFFLMFPLGFCFYLFMEWIQDHTDRQENFSILEYLP